MNESSRLKQSLIDAMRRPGYEPAGVAELMRLVKAGKSRRGAVKNALRDLAAAGAIVRLPHQRYAPAGDRSRRAAVPPAQTSRSSPAAPGRDGDRVEARVVRTQDDGRLQGEILRVIEKSRRRIVGVYRAARGGDGVVDAWDRRFEGGIDIPAGSADGATAGLVVGVELVNGPEEGRRALGRVVEVLGPADAPETELRAVIRKYGLREQFPPDVLDQAAGVPERVAEADLQGREDFRSLP